MYIFNNIFEVRAYKLVFRIKLYFVMNFATIENRIRAFGTTKKICKKLQGRHGVGRRDIWVQGYV